MKRRNIPQLTQRVEPAGRSGRNARNIQSAPRTQDEFARRMKKKLKKLKKEPQRGLRMDLEIEKKRKQIQHPKGRGRLFYA